VPTSGSFLSSALGDPIEVQSTKSSAKLAERLIGQPPVTSI
jgi:hypothetical protein